MKIEMFAISWVLSFLVKAYLQIKINQLNNEKDDLKNWNAMKFAKKSGNKGDKLVKFHNIFTIAYFFSVLICMIFVVISSLKNQLF